MHLTETAVNEFVDGTLGDAERRDAERHLAGCAECRQLVDDLREIRRVAGELESREPPVRAWSRIERAIRLEQEHAASTGAPRSGSRRLEPSVFARLKASRSSVTWLAAAAVLVIATAVGIRYSVGTRRAADERAGSAPATSNATEIASAAAVEAELRAAESHYERAIKGLEQITSAQQNALDPKTAATLQKNLAVIDQAISESRAAIRAQPASEPARESLIDSFKAKLALLQDTVALINEMRKGNEAGAARVVSGLKQRGN